MNIPIHCLWMSHCIQQSPDDTHLDYFVIAKNIIMHM